MRFDILQSAISELTARRDEIIVEISGIMNTPGHIKNVSARFSHLLRCLTDYDASLEKAISLEKEFKNIENKNAVEQLVKIQNELNKHEAPKSFEKYSERYHEKPKDTEENTKEFREMQQRFTLDEFNQKHPDIAKGNKKILENYEAITEKFKVTDDDKEKSKKLFEGTFGMDPQAELDKRLHDMYRVENTRTTYKSWDQWYQRCNEIAGVRNMKTVEPFASIDYFKSGMNPEDYMEKLQEIEYKHISTSGGHDNYEGITPGSNYPKDYSNCINGISGGTIQSRKEKLNPYSGF